MKKILCLLLAFALISMAACQKEENSLVENLPEESTTTPEAELVQSKDELFWTTGIEPVRYKIEENVKGTTETYVRELTNEKYQGRAGGSKGNRLAADWLAEQFERIGLQKLPTLDGWKQNYSTASTVVLPGEAVLVAPDGSETKLILGEDWMFRASPQVVDVTASLTTDEARYKEGNAIWDAYEVPKGANKKLCLTVREMDNGISYINPTGSPSRILVTETVYQQLKQDDWKLHLNLPDAIDEDGNADNVVAYLPGKDPTKAVVIGANFDGSGQCGPLLLPGAYNNASGVATLIQTAEWLTKVEKLPCDVIFAAFNTEDNQQNGSAVLAEHIKEKYQQIRMINLKCIGFKNQPMTVFGDNSEAILRNSLAGGLEMQYADYSIGSDEQAFTGNNMSAVLIFQEACLNDEEASSVVNTTRDIADNLDFTVLDDTAKHLAEWIVERGDEPLKSFAVYW